MIQKYKISKIKIKDFDWGENIENIFIISKPDITTIKISNLQ